MITFKNLFDNENIVEKETMDGVHVLEYKQDLSVSYLNAINEYYAAKMNVRKRQVLIELDGNAFVISAGAMQWMSGQVKMTSDVKGVGDFIGKAIGGKVSKESAIKPKYTGNGLLMLEPTFKHILLEQVANWGTIVLEDGLFLACDANLQQKIVSRKNFSSALAGGEGLFNLSLSGKGVAVLESPVPREELVIVEMDNDEIRIDGPLAIAWSDSLTFTVEKSSKSLIGSAVSGEGLVNVYRGTGKILMSPVG